MRSRRLLILIVTMLALVVPALGAMLHSSHPTSAQTTQQLNVDPNAFNEGSVSTVKVTGSGYDAGSSVDLESVVSTDDPSNPVADEKYTATAAPDGSIDDNAFPVPANISPGFYLLTAIEENSSNFASASYTVNQDSTTPTVTGTPATSTPTVTGTPATNTPTATPTATNTVSPTATGTPATSTPTSTAVITLTPTATSTPNLNLPPPPAPPGGASTSTPTPTVTPTSTDTPTVTPTATETPIPPPLTFSVVATKIGYGSSDPSKMRTKKSLKHVTLGSRVKLLIYTKVSGIVDSLPITLGFRVTKGKPTVYLNKVDETLTPADDGKTLSWFQLFAPGSKGSFRFHGTLFVGGHHKHKIADFTVG